jgi:hypothetical protein
MAFYEEKLLSQGPSGNKLTSSLARTANLLYRPGIPRPVTAVRASPSLLARTLSRTFT